MACALPQKTAGGFFCTLSFGGALVPHNPAPRYGPSRTNAKSERHIRVYPRGYGIMSKNVL